MRLLTYFAAALLLGVTAGATWDALDPPARGHQARVAEAAPIERTANVWLLEINGGGTGTAFPVACEPDGSLWLVTFMTAGHCVADGEDGQALYHLRRHDGKIALGREGERMPGFDPTGPTDIGLVRAWSFEPVYVHELSHERMRWLEPLLLVGYPSGEGPYATQGLWSGDQRVSCSAFPGSSGSPVFDEEGRVRGVLVAGYGNGWQFIDFMCLIAPLEGAGDWVRSEIGG